MAWPARSATTRPQMRRPASARSPIRSRTLWRTNSSGKRSAPFWITPAADDDGALVGGAADEAHVAEHGLVFPEAEGSRRGDEPGVVAAFEVADEGFAADGRGEVDHVVDGVAFAGVDADELVAFAHFDILEDAEILAFAAAARLRPTSRMAST